MNIAGQSLYPAVREALTSRDSEHKVRQSQWIYRAWRDGALAIADCPTAPQQPGLPAHLQLVHPNQLKRRSPHTEHGRAVLIHAIAHIEFNAINLALDAVLRFPLMPDDYRTDWLKVASEEAYHFQLIRARLQEVGYDYGDFPGHNGLWDVAQRSAHSALERMAVVPRVLEARGLDVTPAMQKSLRNAGDEATASILDIIFRDEIGHVAVGTKWFQYLCDQSQLDYLDKFEDIVKRYYSGSLRGPFNHEARKASGFNADELKMLESMGSQ